MALIQEVKAICRRLGPGWVDLLGEFGLDLRAANLAAELARPLAKLRPDRRPNVAGFEDLDPRAIRGIEPGIPDRSLPYHALASPNVRHDRRGRLLRGSPTLRDLEVVENYVHGVRPPTLAALRRRAEAVQAGAGRRLAVVVLSYEYRPGGQTVHENFAGTVFSRTGVTRVGTDRPRYSGRERGFTPAKPGDLRAFCVLPARYAAYIAFEHRGPRADVFGPHRSDRAVDGPLRFWVPLHKLFSGRECIRGLNLGVRLAAYHVNDKLARLHRLFGPGNANVANPDLARPPFTFEQGIAELSTQRSLGQGVLGLHRLASQWGDRLSTSDEEVLTWALGVESGSLASATGKYGGRLGCESWQIRHYS